MKIGLTDKQRTFVEEYLVDLCATQAAIRAGYSKKTAAVIGAQNLTKLNIQVAIKAAIDARSKRTGITADNVLKEIALISFMDIREIFTPAGNLKWTETICAASATAIQSVEVVIRSTGEVDEDGNREVEHVYKIRLADKLKGLEMLCKHLGLFNNKATITPGGVHIKMNYGPPDRKVARERVTIEGSKAQD